MKTYKKNNTDSIGSLSLSDSILSGATITSQPAGYTFPHHLHSTIEIYRIISGECLMDVQSETLHCTKGDFIMILPNIVHSFYLNKNLTVRLNTSTLIQHVFKYYFRKRRRLSDHINACSFIFFAFLLPFLGRRRNRQYIRQADQPLYRL